MTRQGNYLWYYDQYAHYIGRTTTGGSLSASFIPNDNTIRDLTWDGTHIWAMNTSGEIKKFTTSGAHLDTISNLLTSGWGLTYDGLFLWASDPVTDKIYKISPFDDDEPPGPPAIESTTHPLESSWYSNPDPVFTLTPPDDPSGIAGFSYLLDRHAGTVPDNAIDGTGTTIGYSSIWDGVWYFHCRARDYAGNWGVANHYGIHIDTTPPESGTILIEDDADTTNSPRVTLSNLQAEDSLSGMGSGAAMIFSNDGFLWSNPEPFAETRPDWDLTQYGGDDFSGLKKVFVSFRDVAGNGSGPFSNEIVYSAPLLITTESTDNGTLGFAYAETLSASGGWPPYSWEIIGGALPSGLILDPGGIISGDPDSDGTFYFTLRVTDANNYSVTADFSLSIFTESVKGDVTGDTDVNILDLVSVVRYILGLEEYTVLQFWAADVIPDSTIDVTDVLGIVNIILGLPYVTKTPSSSGRAIVGIEEDAHISKVHNSETFLSFTLREKSFVTLAVYNALGQKVRTLMSEERIKGEHVVSWSGTDSNGRPLPSGVYFCKMEAGPYGEVREMVLLK